MQIEKTPENLVLGKAALQSSFSAYSRVDDPIGALSGVTTGGYGFHTEEEINPWWMVDLGEIMRVKTIIIYNRCDGAAQRARNFRVQIFDVAIGLWKTVYAGENEFGGVADGNPLRLEFGSRPKSARFVKVEIQGTSILHLDQIEIYGSGCKEAYRNRMTSEDHKTIKSEDNGTEVALSLGAIVGLVRGYDDVSKYNPLISRNRAIFDKINKHLDHQYPLIIWHEGNISLRHQDYILEREMNKDVRFLDVSREFNLPDHVSVDRLKESWPLGYRLMCKTNTWDIWNLAKEFKYVLRIDEDCILEEIIHDPFRWMESAELDCAFSLLINDNHDLTNETLPCFVEAYLDKRGEFSPAIRPLTSQFPYTNLMMARVGFFRSEVISTFLRYAVQEQDFYANRWGDHIVLGVVLNLYSKKERIQPIPDLCYHHHSHSLLVKSNDDLRKNNDATATEHFSRELDEMSDNDVLEHERYLVKCYVVNPLNTELRGRIIEVARRLGRHELATRLSVRAN